MFEDGKVSFDEIKDIGGEGSNYWYYVVICEGCKCEVWRMWEIQNVQVSCLIWVCYGVVELLCSLKVS